MSFSWSQAQYRKWESDVDEHIHICDPLPENFDKSGCHGRDYRDFEERVEKYLLENGWFVIDRFVTADGDDFGPLVRLAKFRRPDGKIVELLHG